MYGQLKEGNKLSYKIPFPLGMDNLTKITGEISQDQIMQFIYPQIPDFDSQPQEYKNQIIQRVKDYLKTKEFQSHNQERRKSLSVTRITFALCPLAPPPWATPVPAWRWQPGPAPAAGSGPPVQVRRRENERDAEPLTISSEERPLQAASRASVGPPCTYSAIVLMSASWAISPISWPLSL